MDDLERHVAELLVKPFTGAAPPQELGPRIVHGAARRRRRFVMATAAAGAALLIVVPVVVMQWAGASPGAERTLTASATPSSVRLDALVDQRSVVRIGRVLPGAPPFEARALGRDGTVLGVVDRGGGERTVPATGVWRVEPGSSTPRRLVTLPSQQGAFLWTMAASEQGYLWPNGEGLTCLGPNGKGPVRTLSANAGGKDAFYAGDGVFVWSEDGSSVIVSDGCAATTRRFPVPGELVAFSYPHVFVRSSNNVRQLDVRSGVVKALTAVGAPEGAVFAADRHKLLWTDGDMLMVHDRRTGATRQELRGLPNAGTGYYFGRLATNGRFVVYSAEHQDDASDSTAIVLDLSTGRKAKLPGQAWITGNRLLWRDGNDYLLAHLRA